MSGFRVLRLPFAFYTFCLFFSLSVATSTEGNGGSIALNTFRGRGKVSSVSLVVERVLGVSISETPLVLEISNDVPVEYESEYEGKGFFMAYNHGSKVVIKGSSGIDIAYGVGWYLRRYCNMSFSWRRTGGNNIQIPSIWPRLQAKVFEQRGFLFSYFNNVCTFSYSYVWYRWRDWEEWLDWAALSGINLVLAYTGQEEIWRKTYNEFGVTDAEFAQWSNGEAFLTWSRGQSMHGISSPLSTQFMKGQWKLQKLILKRMRDLGMIAVLPTFQGNLPPQMKKLFPLANMSLARTSTGSKTCWLDCRDKLFKQIQAVYMGHLIRDFGTDHWYETDGSFDQTMPPWFNSNVQHKTKPNNAKQPPVRSWKDVSIDENARAHSKAVYSSMQSVDSEAIWLYQGWIWRGWGADKLSYMKGWISGIPRNKFIILNMVDESPQDTLWNKFSNFSFFGAPFIWSVLHNFGGNVGMSGALATLNQEPFKARGEHTSVVGTGAAPEGIDQNPIYYSLLADISYRVQRFPSIQSYVRQWTISRYGTYLAKADEAWKLLLDTVYSFENNDRALRSTGCFYHEKNHDALIALPLYVQPNTGSWYDESKVAMAWKSLGDAAATYVKGVGKSIPRTLNYDLVNVGREVLGKLGSKIYQDMSRKGATVHTVVTAGKKLVELVLNMDDLLCTEESFMAWPWIESARLLAREYNDSEANYVAQARSQTSTWSVPPKSLERLSYLHDYANKEWGGQMRAFYARRLQCYLNQGSKVEPTDVFSVNRTEYLECVARVSYEWTHDIEGTRLPVCTKPTGDAIALSETLLKKYQLGRSVMNRVQEEY